MGLPDDPTKMHQPMSQDGSSGSLWGSPLQTGRMGTPMVRERTPYDAQGHVVSPLGMMGRGLSGRSLVKPVFEDAPSSQAGKSKSASTGIEELPMWLLGGKQEGEKEEDLSFSAPLPASTPLWLRADGGDGSPSRAESPREGALWLSASGSTAKQKPSGEPGGYEYDTQRPPTGKTLLRTSLTRPVRKGEEGGGRRQQGPGGTNVMLC